MDDRSWAVHVDVGPGKNSTYAHGRGGRLYLPDETLAWRATVAHQLEGSPKLVGAVAVTIEIVKRDDLPEWDLDHHISPVLDAITRGGGWTDDDVVETLAAIRRQPEEGEPEHITVYAWELDADEPF